MANFKKQKKILASGALADPSGAFRPNLTLRAEEGTNAGAFATRLAPNLAKMRRSGLQVHLKFKKKTQTNTKKCKKTPNLGKEIMNLEKIVV